MSQLLVDDIVNKDGTGSPGFSKGAVVTGVATATTFKGALTGDVTGNISGATGDFTGNVSVGGTLTYADVTNIDAVGLVTARTGVRVTAGGLVVTAGVSTLGGGTTMADSVSSYWGTGGDLQIFSDGDNGVLKGLNGRIYQQSDTGINFTKLGNAETFAIFTPDGSCELYCDNTKRIETTPTGAVVTGIITATGGTDLDGFKVEEGKQDGSTQLNGEFDYKLENGHVQRYSNATGGNYFPDFKVSSSKSLSSVMDVGDVISVTLIVVSSSHYCTTGIKIDDSTSNLDIDWVGGSAPSAANGSGYDVYAFTIMKTAATPAYHIIGNALGVA